MNYIERINKYSPEFTKSDHKIKDRILQNPRIVEEYTVSKVAEVTRTSTAAIIRFCRKLGYSGYSEFRYDLIKSIHVAPADPQTSLKSSFFSAYSQGVQALDSIDEQQYLQLYSLIKQADFINCLGSYNSALPAMKFYYDFTALGKRVLPLTGSLSPWTNQVTGKNDLIIVFSVSGGIANYGVSDYLDNAKKMGCSIVLITCSSKSKIAKYATHIFQLPTVHTENGTVVEAQSLMMMVVSVLTAYAKQDL